MNKFVFNSDQTSPHINLRDYRLIVFDIDGTLIGSNHILDPYTRDVLLKLRDYGINMTLATGKNLPATQQTADELEIEIPLVLSNGSMIETRYGEILAKSVLPVQVIKRVTEICDSKNSNLVMYLDNEILIKGMNEDIFQVYNQVAYGISEIGQWSAIASRQAEVNKCLIVEQHNPANLKELEKVFNQDFGTLADILFTSTKLLEVIPKGITKVTGIQKIASSLGIKMSEVMAFGDYDNDVEMLTAAGLGIVVENGSQAAKASADLVIGSCDQNGPAIFLENLMRSI